jgi:hypothetical protein
MRHTLYTHAGQAVQQREGRLSMHRGVSQSECPWTASDPVRVSAHQSESLPAPLTSLRRV